MNFQELLQRMNELDQPVVEEPNEGNLFTGNLAAAREAGKSEADLDGDGDMEKVREDDVEECGMDMGASPMKQQDNVNMNVSMNGSGAGGIRDLLDILKNLDSGGEDGADLGDLIDKMEPPMSGPSEKDVIVGDSVDAGFSDATTSPNVQTKDTEYMTKDISGGFGTQQDMHPHGYQNGDNPLAMEQLISRLDSLYQQVKSQS